MSIVTSVCFLLQAIILILFRYLQTSIGLAIKKGDSTADSLAYILSICLPTDDMTEDKCMRPVTASAAPTIAPSFADAPPSTSQTLQQAATTLAAVGQPINIVPGADGTLAAKCGRVPGLTPINNSALPGSGALSNRSSVISMSAAVPPAPPPLPYYGRASPGTN